MSFQVAIVFYKIFQFPRKSSVFCQDWTQLDKVWEIASRGHSDWQRSMTRGIGASRMFKVTSKLEEYPAGIADFEMSHVSSLTKPSVFFSNIPFKQTCLFPIHKQTFVYSWPDFLSFAIFYIRSKPVAISTTRTFL